MALKDRADLAPVLFDRLAAELRRGFASLGFLRAVDWKEPWLVGLLTFHVVLLLITIITRRNMNFQLPLSFLSLSGVCFAEPINCFLAKHWKSFAGQNYFDTNGCFISALWSGPLLFITDVVLRMGSLQNFGVTNFSPAGSSELAALNLFIPSVHPSTEPDVLRWRWDNRGRFSARSAYHFLVFDGVDDRRITHLWSIKIPPKVKFFLWLAARNRIFAADLLVKRG